MVKEGGTTVDGLDRLSIDDVQMWIIATDAWTKASSPPESFTDYEE